MPTPTARSSDTSKRRRELFRAAGLADLADDGYVPLDTTGVEAFITACRQLRYWDREPTVDTA